jgi:hypothetical protein
VPMGVPGGVGLFGRLIALADAAAVKAATARAVVRTFDPILTFSLQNIVLPLLNCACHRRPVCDRQTDPKHGPALAFH